MVLAKIFWSIVVVVLTLIPFWFWLFLDYFVAPTGFWQKFFMVSAGLYFLGGVQILFLIVGIIVIAVILTR